MTPLDWMIILVFFVCMLLIAFITSRMNRSVAGFLSSERLAGRYLLTVAQAMAFFSAIGIIGQFESIYRNGLGGLWWGLIYIPIHTVISLTGFVVYRFRETRALTMAQFLEMRYGKKLRVFAGFVGFFAGILNCGVFPLVTTTFLVYFLQLPESFALLGFSLSTFHAIMFFMIAFAVLMAVAGGQITIMVTDFFQGAVSTVALLGGITYILYTLGWSGLIGTLGAAEALTAPTEHELLLNVVRPEGASMVNPFQMGGVLDFGVPFFMMMGLLQILRTGVWQGGSGYMAAARSPHEAKMGNILGGWRWLLQIMGTTFFALAAYVIIWNPEFAADRLGVAQSLDGVEDTYLQGQLLVPLALFQLFPPGMTGLFVILMIGASISTDNSAYHSWGSIFLQDAVLPLRQKPFSKEEHLFWLRISIVMIGLFAFILSSFWTMRDYIFMWFQITNSIYVGGASCAIIGGLYWKKATRQGAWAGFLTGSILSVGGIILRQLHPGITFPWSDQVIDGLYMAVFTIFISYTVFFVVSLITFRADFDMDRLLHRGAYAVAGDHPAPGAGGLRGGILRRMGITPEFTRFDRLIYLAAMGWTAVMVATFVGWTSINVLSPLSTEVWRMAWSGFIPVMLFVVFSTGIWFFFGGLRDLLRLFRGLAAVEPDSSDDGTVEAPRRGGFTLIELLVVIAILGLLLGLTLPMAGRAMDRGRIAKSMNNLRQIGQITIQYAAENKALLPSGGPVQEAGRHFWIEELYPMAYNTSFPGFLPWETGANVRGTFFHSPMLKSSEPTPHRSYSWNRNLHNAGTADPRVNLSRLRSPAMTLLCADGKNSSNINHTPLGNQAFSYRNNGRALILFADGHVESRSPEEIPRRLADSGFDLFWFRNQ